MGEAAYITAIMEQFDRETVRLRFSRVLCGDPDGAAEIVAAREDQRVAIVRRIEVEESAHAAARA